MGHSIFRSDVETNRPISHLPERSLFHPTTNHGKTLATRQCSPHQIPVHGLHAVPKAASTDTAKLDGDLVLAHLVLQHPTELVSNWRWLY